MPEGLTDFIRRSLPRSSGRWYWGPPDKKKVSVCVSLCLPRRSGRFIRLWRIVLGCVCPVECEAYSSGVAK